MLKLMLVMQDDCQRDQGEFIIPFRSLSAYGSLFSLLSASHVKRDREVE